MQQSSTLGKREAQSSEASVGKRLRALRTGRQLSVSELAEQAGVSVGMISQIERNMANPSIRILERLRRALSVPLTALLEEGGEGGGDSKNVEIVRKAQDRPIFEVSTSGMTKELLSPRGDHDLQLMIISLPAGASSEDVLVGIGEKAGWVLEGTVVLRVGNQRSELHPGDSFQFKSTAPHSIHNESKRGARLLWIMNTRPPVVHI